ncbi:MAG: response regulator transcription factor [Desulfobacterales bacterium]|nr:response regulator transcription factor [Deltaproteobacteria bacterium]NNL41991.1 response regulator transcription factor [Desulfobacterales bacterium]
MKTYQKTDSTVLIVDEYPLFRKSLKCLLGKVSGYDVIDEAESGIEGILKAMEHKPDLIIMDISLPDMSGIHFINKLKDSKINSRIIIVSLHSDAVYVSEAFKYGVSGYFSKLSDLGLLVNDLKASKRAVSQVSGLA